MMAGPGRGTALSTIVSVLFAHATAEVFLVRLRGSSPPTLRLRPRPTRKCVVQSKLLADLSFGPTSVPALRGFDRACWCRGAGRGRGGAGRCWAGRLVGKMGARARPRKCGLCGDALGVVSLSCCLSCWIPVASNKPSF